MRAYSSIVVVLCLLSGPDQLSVVHILMLMYFKPFFFNVAKSAADPWYLQQTRKSLVKVRINVSFMVKK